MIVITEEWTNGLNTCSQHMNWTELTSTSWPIYMRRLLVQRVSITIYSVLIGYRHCNDVGRLVLNTRIPKGLLTLKFANCSSVHALVTSLKWVVCCRQDWTQPLLRWLGLVDMPADVQRRIRLLPTLLSAVQCTSVQQCITQQQP